jgi:hypothetical protein
LLWEATAKALPSGTLQAAATIEQLPAAIEERAQLCTGMPDHRNRAAWRASHRR